MEAGQLFDAVRAAGEVARYRRGLCGVTRLEAIEAAHLDGGQFEDLADVAVVAHGSPPGMPDPASTSSLTGSGATLGP